MDGQTDRLTDRPTDGPIDRPTDWRTTRLQELLRAAENPPCIFATTKKWFYLLTKLEVLEKITTSSDKRITPNYSHLMSETNREKSAWFYVKFFPRELPWEFFKRNKCFSTDFQIFGWKNPTGCRIKISREALDSP